MKRFFAIFLVSASLLMSCGQDRGLTLLVPSGSPLISVAGVLDDVNYEVTVGPDLLPVAFTKGEKDLIIAPIITGAKLYNAQVSQYQLAAMLGWGNLHILSRTPLTSIDDLAGKNVLAFAEHSTPGMMLRLATEAIDVNITYFKAVSDVGAPFLTKQYDYVLLSEPILSKIVANSTDSCFTYSLQNVAHLPKIAQFGLFIHPHANVNQTSSFLAKLETNLHDLNEDPLHYANQIVDLDLQLRELGVELIAQSIPQTDLAYVSSLDAKSDVTDFLAYLINADRNLIGAEMVHENFFAS